MKRSAGSGLKAGIALVAVLTISVGAPGYVGTTKLSAVPEQGQSFSGTIALVTGAPITFSSAFQ